MKKKIIYCIIFANAVIFFILIFAFSNLISNGQTIDESNSSLPEGFTSAGNGLSIYVPETTEVSEYGFIGVEKTTFNKPSNEYFQQLEETISEEVEIAKAELSLSENSYNFANQNLNSSQIPTSFDLRNVNSNNYITGVVNQGSYGACWAFSIANSLETSAFINGITESLTQFSKVHLVNSVFNNWTFSIKQTADTGIGNFGGNAYLGPSGLQKGFSPQLESSFPYSQANQTFLSNVSSFDKTALSQHIGNLSQITYLPDIVPFPGTAASRTVNGSYTYYTNQVAIEAVKLSLMQIKPVFVGFLVNSTGCSTMNCFNGSGTLYANHAVSIIGWDDNYSKNNFSDNGEKPPANGAFIVKNSWGTSWGDGGYFYLSYYDQSIQQLSTFDLTDLSDYTFDSYSDVGWDYALAYFGGTTFTYANVFWTDDFANSEDQLYGIQFYSIDPEETSNIKIYLDNSASSAYGLIPTSGSLVYETTYTPGYTGMNTLFLKNSIQLNPNSNYSVVITVSVPKGHYATGPIETYSDYQYMSYAIVNDDYEWGHSFYSNSSNWVDNMFFNLKADYLIKGIRSVSGLIPPDLNAKPDLPKNPVIEPSNTTTYDDFEDVAQLSAARSAAISWLRESKITAGCDSSGKLFCPNTTVNRGSMAQFLYNLAKYLGRTNDTKNAKPNFSDTKTLSASRSQAIDWLYQEGITGGCSNNKYCPNTLVNRGSMALFLQKFAKEINIPTQSSYFADVKGGSGTYKVKYEGSTKTVSISKLSTQRVAAINWLYLSDISGGSGSINDKIAFRPQDPVNRGSMAQFLKKLYDYLDN